MDKRAKIFIAGHNGLVGSAILKKLKEQGYSNFVLRSSSELDLRNQYATSQFFSVEKPEYVFLAAAKVGGIVANNIYRADFIVENLQIQQHVIQSAYQTGVRKLLFLGSSCIYPGNAPQPMKEDCLLTSPLEYTNEPYAIAKIAGIKICESYNIQYGTNFIPVMPTNLYGHNDNFNLEKSHVLPAIIRKMHLGKALSKDDWGTIRVDFDHNPVEDIDGKATQELLLEKLNKYGIHKHSGATSITLWGTGKPRREFLFSDDLAEACIFIMNSIEFSDLVNLSGNKTGEIRNTHINIGSGTDLSIAELAAIIKQVVGFQGEVIWDSSKPDGTFQKLLDVSKLERLGWKYKTKPIEGIENVYKNYNQV